MINQGSTTSTRVPHNNRIDRSLMEQFCEWMPFAPSPIVHYDEQHKNPSAIFVLSPPRSGSTLLRVMMAGHPDLFSPPELSLLPFNSLRERNIAFTQDGQLFLDSPIHAIMHIEGCQVEQARQKVKTLEDQNCTIDTFYRLIQTGIDNKILVDKSPINTFYIETLTRAEHYFVEPRYVHLVRHPYATIYSFEEDQLERYFESWRTAPFPAREIAELVWLLCHVNTIQFLENVPKERHYRLKFEDLVQKPEPTMKKLCQFLDIEFTDELLQPYKEQHKRMTEGITSQKKMVGDPKFYQHNQINPNVADRWKQKHGEEFLSDFAWQVAESLGYSRM